MSDTGTLGAQFGLKWGRAALPRVSDTGFAACGNQVPDAAGRRSGGSRSRRGSYASAMTSGAPPPVRALTFDFNGTLSADEPILCEIVRGLFAERGRPLSEQEYYDELAGLSDEAAVRRWLGEGYPDVEGAVGERISRYRSLVADGSTIRQPVREAVRYAASRVPLLIVSGAAREEIEPVVEAAGLTASFRSIVSSDDVVLGKPHPESYELAVERLGVSPGQVLAFEDTESGIASARGAGVRCVAVRGTLRPERLAGAEELIDGIDVAVIARLLA